MKKIVYLPIYMLMFVEGGGLKNDLRGNGNSLASLFVLYVIFVFLATVSNALCHGIDQF